jgi:hypothetical protein
MQPHCGGYEPLTSSTDEYQLFMDHKKEAPIHPLSPKREKIKTRYLD